ncbi:MAG: Glucitol operon repressor [Actinobacteria bacterium ADurb.Bin346]|nr:MAG: Glucitol operon repressor [Actinobacteria bacterium ADurb.Bin346]
MAELEFPEDRRDRIIEIIKKNNGRISIKDLFDQFNISQSALYKDLNILENRGLVIKSYGKLALNESEERKHNFFQNLQKNAGQKKAIGKCAASKVTDNETIFMDGSSTTFYFCEALKRRSLKNITIITNSIFIPRVLIMEDNINIITVGGIVNKLIGTSDGDIWEALVKNTFYANKFFFSCYSMSTDVGVLDPIQNDASMKAVFALKSQKNICLVDSSKFQQYSTFNWIGLDEIDVIISDTGIESDTSKKLMDKGIELIIAE